MGYIALASPEAILALPQSLARVGRPFLWITDRTSLPDLEGGRVLRVTALGPREGAVDPKRLGDLRAAAGAFVSDQDSGLVVLDCLENLVLRNGAERVLRILADIHDEVTMHGGSLIVLADARQASPRLVAWLERELDVLAFEEPDARQVGFLSA